MICINGREINASSFAFDGCHKIYICESDMDEVEAKGAGYVVFPIEEIKEAYQKSCDLRFINNWQLTESYCKQFEDAVFT